MPTVMATRLVMFSACRRNRSRVPPTFSAMENGQIKGVGNAGKGARVGYMKKWLSMLGFLLGGCGKDVWGM